MMAPMARSSRHFSTHQIPTSVADRLRTIGLRTVGPGPLQRGFSLRNELGYPWVVGPGRRIARGQTIPAVGEVRFAVPFDG
jgi:hypothetical protein